MKRAILLMLFVSSLTTMLTAKNPILKQGEPNFMYLADPAAELYNGKVYVYCSHDQDTAVGYSTMQDYVILESEDLKTWKSHGVVLSPRKFSWASGQMNAPDAAYKDGWYYFYFPAEKDKVAIAKSRTPDFADYEVALDGFLTYLFDPTVFIDDDGQAYIYGNSGPNNASAEAAGFTYFDSSTSIYGAKLNDDMISIHEDGWHKLTVDGSLAEGVHIFKRNGKYYFTGRSTGWTGIYWMADEPLPTTSYAEYKGAFYNTRRAASSSVTGISDTALVYSDGDPSPPHHSAIEFNNQWYLFYHRGELNGGNGSRRSACFDELHFNSDGTIIPFDDLTYDGNGYAVENIVTNPFTVDYCAGNQYLYYTLNITSWY